jgi:ribonuclease HI
MVKELWSDGPRKVYVSIDGCARGNPGHAGCGVVVADDEGRVILTKTRYLGATTNNVAEYTALIEGLREAIEVGAQDVTVQTDSELVARQMKGEYKVKDVKLKHLFAEARRLSQSFSSATFVHVERKNNRDADRLANEAVDNFLCVPKENEHRDPLNEKNPNRPS